MPVAGPPVAMYKAVLAQVRRPCFHMGAGSIFSYRTHGVGSLGPCLEPAFGLIFFYQEYHVLAPFQAVQAIQASFLGHLWLPCLP
jgi:hypothetical protein